VRVEDDAQLDAAAVVRFADQALAGLEHRRVGFEVVPSGERVRAGLEELGWKVTRLVWMRLEDPAPAGAVGDVEQVPYDAVRHLRVEWHREDFPAVDPTDYLEHARELSANRHAQVFAAFHRDAPVGFAQLERTDDGAEITDVYVRPDHRGRGFGTALTQAAIDTGRDAGDLWIVTDEDDRAKELYTRLGFRSAWRVLDFLRVPG
jgi:GNAT superfamily N-acetyltransferase